MLIGSLHLSFNPTHIRRCDTREHTVQWGRQMRCTSRSCPARLMKIHNDGFAEREGMVDTYMGRLMAAHRSSSWSMYRVMCLVGPEWEMG